MEHCPNCRARIDEDEHCRRCGMELGALRAAERAAERWLCVGLGHFAAAECALHLGVAHLAEAERAAAEARGVLRRSLALRRDPLAQRLLDLLR